MPVAPFTLPFSQGDVDDLRRRLAHTRWPDAAPEPPWDYGVDLAFLKEICRYWQDEFAWQRQVEKLAALPHFRFTHDGLGIHFLHVRGSGPRPMPLLLTHGWPGSFLEFLRILPLLTNPAAHGGDAADAFDVVIPSLPGFGYSDHPATSGVNAFRVAEIWTHLMTALGYPRFAAQGGDIGAAVSTALGLRYADRVIGLHLNYIPGSYRPWLDDTSNISDAEKNSLATNARWFDEEGAYAHLQRTRPQTAAYALNDSPSGLAAWILEKFRAWADCDGDLSRTFTRDELLTNVTLYWMTQTIGSSMRMYRENSQAPLHFSREDFVRPPTAFAHFPKEIPTAPRSWLERGFNLQRWTEMSRGGHFAAMEQPQLLADDIRAFFRELRS
jgi:pimeloyl-ACP methyl ester carboxylesterase